uniref:ADP,ATP carrier protein n=1 Tax=Ditylenchus dipsaci TaxID=166011 RepID=A0A915DCV6_9BILA
MHQSPQFVAIVFFVQQSPRWLHVQGRANRLLHNDPTQELSNLMHTELLGQHPADKCSQSAGFFLWSKVVFYSLNGCASIVLQYSSDYYNTWGVQLALLSGCQLLAYLLTSCISEQHLHWSLLLCLTIAGFFSFLLMLVPLGMFYALLLQIVKLVACVCDHLTLYHLLNLPLEDAISNGYAARTPHSYSFAKTRLKLTVLAETMSGLAKTAAIFFIAKTFSEPTQSRDQIPKFLICTACYSINLLWLISYGRVASTQQQAYQQAPTMVSFDRPMPLLLSELLSVKVFRSVRTRKKRSVSQPAALDMTITT